MISEHAVGITLRGSGLKIDVAPVLYEGAPDDRGYLITRQGDRVLTSVTLHLAFIRSRRDAAGPNYRELIRLLKAWIREAKRNDADLRCKSFLLELIVAHLWDQGWNGEPLAVDDYPRAFEQVLGYIARTGLAHPGHLHRLLREDRGHPGQQPDPGLGPGQPGEQRRPHLHRGRPAAPGQDRDHRAGGDRLGRAWRPPRATPTTPGGPCSARDSRGHDDRQPRHQDGHVHHHRRALRRREGRRRPPAPEQPVRPSQPGKHRRFRRGSRAAAARRLPRHGRLRVPGHEPRTRGSCGSATPRPRAGTSSTTAPASSPPGRPSPGTPFSATSPTARPSTP